MTYSEAIQFLYGLQLFGANFGLERTRRLAELAGNPHERLQFIHVAGTNGKGSVCAILESVYRHAGLRTGLFTSPHLVHFGERLQVDRQLPEESEIIDLVERLRNILKEGARRGWWDPTETAGESMTGLGHPTFFEVVTIMALIHFAGKQCDIVLWETGLGGRLDATNIVTPLASVITTVSLEHASILGDSTIKIAAEKSGIIKPGVPLITGADDSAAMNVLREVATSRGAPITEVSGCIGVPPNSGPSSAPPDAPVVERVFPPGYQRANARLALAVVERLQSKLPVTPFEWETGLKSVQWPGRLQEFIRGGRRIIVDGAHNPAGMRALKFTLSARPDWQPCAVIFGTFSDKDARAELEELATLATQILFVPVQSPRTAATAELRKDFAVFDSRAIPATECASLAEAIERTRAEPVTLITGSLYLVGEAVALLQEETLPTIANELGLNNWNPTPLAGRR